MGEHRHPARGRQTEYVDDFEASGSGRVLDAHTDGEGAGIEFSVQALTDGFDLLGRSRIIGSWAALGQDLGNAGMRADHFGRQRCAEDERARCGVTGCSAVIDKRVTVLLLKKVGHIRNADFQFEGSGYTVEGLHAAAVVILSVLVKIDEAGSDDQAFGAKHADARQRIGGDARYLSVGDADVADGVEA